MSGWAFWGGSRRASIASHCIVAAALLLLGNDLMGQTYPNRPIRFINTFAAGGPAEMVARTVGQRLTEAWGQPVVIDTRAGAAGVIGSEMAARAAPDGYTLLLGTGATLVIAPLLNPKVGYDPIRDFAPVSIVAISPQILVAHPSLPANSVSELVALAKTKPDYLSFGSSGSGSTAHLGGEMLKALAGIRMQHVPYKGAAPSIIDLLAGQIHILFNSMPSSLPHVRAGRLKLLATGGPKRSPAIPDTPTVAETVPGVEVVTWFSVLVPAKTPRDIVLKLNGEVVRAVSAREVTERFVALGLEPNPTTPEAMLAYTRGEIEKYARIIKLSGAKAGS